MMRRRFSLTLRSGTATGTSSVQGGSCTLTIANSTYALGTGPQENRVIRLNPCNFDNNTRTLTVTNLVTATSEPGVFQLKNR